MSNLLCVLALLSACSSASTSPVAPPIPPEIPGGDVVASGLVGDWRGYGDPADEGEWERAPLDDDRWARITAELACIGRAHHGDPEEHRAAMRRVLAHHRSDARAVMDYGVAVNADAARAHTLGAQVAEAAQVCR